MQREGSATSELELGLTLEVVSVKVASRANLWMKAGSSGAWLLVACLASVGLDARQIVVCLCLWARARHLPQLPWAFPGSEAICARLHDSLRAAKTLPEAGIPALPREKVLAKRRVLLIQTELRTWCRIRQPRELQL